MRATIVTDLGYGDAGKGSVVDWLCRARGGALVVRHNGGAQAGHNVVTPDGRHHTFHQFGSGTLTGAHTHLSRFTLADPLELAREADALTALGVSDPWGLLTVDRDATVVSPHQKAAGRLRELARGPTGHGTCGAGVGETVADSLADVGLVLRVCDLACPAVVRRKLEVLRDLKRAQLADVLPVLRGVDRAAPEIRTLEDPDLIPAVVDFYSWLSGCLRVVDSGWLGTAMRDAGHTVFEGAHGVLLDEWYGFHPHTTWSTCTTANARTLLADAGFGGEVRSLGLLRAYATRHGPGPFPTEDAGLSARLPDAHNGAGGWQGAFRVGWFDAVTARYAVEVSGGVDELVVTCVDRLYGETDVRMCTAYGHGGVLAERLLVPSSPDLGFQESLTRVAFEARPFYGRVFPGVFGPGPVRDYCWTLGEVVGLPVGLVSLGPTAVDKFTPDDLPCDGRVWSASMT